MKINIKDMDIGGNLNALNKSQLPDNLDFNMEGSKIAGSVEMLNDIQINHVLSEIDKELLQMDRNNPEYAALKEVSKETDYASLKNKLSMHIKAFAGGVLQSVIANLLTNIS